MKKNRENGMRLAETGIDPLPCQSECCDAAEAANYPRSQLYFDGQVNDIDYDKIKVRNFVMLSLWRLDMVKHKQEMLFGGASAFNKRSTRQSQGSTAGSAFAVLYFMP